MTTQQRSFDPENRLFRIVDGDSVSEFVYDANGSRVLKSVSTNGSRERTAYIGGLYEEDLTGSANPPYINYYSLGGKMVGMRRANQASMNGQYRMVTDHLGSASLLVDINGGPSGVPAVVQRQYFRAYGQAGYTWSNGGSLSDIGYTGQRTEGTTGLIFYNARFYDPELSYFASADTIGVDKGLSQSRNRYGYVNNNPVRYSDPSGHCVTDGKEAQPQNQRESDECPKIRAKFRALGIQLWGTWNIDELLIVLMGIDRLLQKTGWSYEDFQRAIGGGRWIVFHRTPKPLDGMVATGVVAANNGAFAYQAGDSLAIIEIHDLMFYTPESLAAGRREFAPSLLIAKTVVHELAHLWNYASDGRLEYEHYHAATSGELPVSAAGERNADEDFAETVAAMVFPDDPRQVSDRYDKAVGRRSFVNTQFATYCISGCRDSRPPQ